ncbi:hypothetical protein N1031_18685 [Herbiconiux moechotypicola]|uniref:Uncharacterized protein n=1 Tax=Herbiconiux moechotypicola TaxID=637393 RepID=A0ABN3E4V6_9MICO|nr:hypothetical protein [Herbiconiux moechotypicola]MCS5731786.1 hypothetical protein [Herbiconiux moechotypicola]
MSGDEIDPRRRERMRALLVEHARRSGSTVGHRAPRWVGVAAAVAVLVGLAGTAAIVSRPVSGGEASAGATSTPSAEAGAESHPLDPAGVPFANTSSPPAGGPQSNGEAASAGDAGDSGAVADAASAYAWCVEASDVWDAPVDAGEGMLPAAPTLSVASLADSEVLQPSPGVWTVVIPVVRLHPEGERVGVKVCTITGPADQPVIEVTDALD